jgi:hypothetical protein
MIIGIDKKWSVLDINARPDITENQNGEKCERSTVYNKRFDLTHIKKTESAWARKRKTRLTQTSESKSNRTEQVLTPIREKERVIIIPIL